MYNIENKEIELFKKLSPFLWQLTRSCHVFLYLDVAFASLPVLSIFFPSTPPFFVGLPHVRCPCMFQSKAYLVTLLSFLLKVCPIHFHFLDLIWNFLGCCHVECLRFFSGHRIPRMFPRHRPTKVRTLLFEVAGSFHVSDPYRIIDGLTLVLKICILVMVLSARLLQTDWSIWMIC